MMYLVGADGRRVNRAVLWRDKRATLLCLHRYSGSGRRILRDVCLATTVWVDSAFASRLNVTGYVDKAKASCALDETRLWVERAFENPSKDVETIVRACASGREMHAAIKRRGGIPPNMHWPGELKSDGVVERLYVELVQWCQLARADFIDERIGARATLLLVDSLCARCAFGDGSYDPTTNTSPDPINAYLAQCGFSPPVSVGFIPFDAFVCIEKTDAHDGVFSRTELMEAKAAVFKPYHVMYSTCSG